MDIKFPVAISNKRAFAKLMQIVEKENPNVIWAAGQKPTQYTPRLNAFPVIIYLTNYFGEELLTFEQVRN